MHGASVAAHPGEGRGNEFLVRRPLPGAARDNTDATEQISPTTVKNTRRILIVDDNEDSAEVTSILLSLEGHEVAIAHCGTEALEKVPSVRPDVLLLDIGMPNMDGYELARRMREMPETRHAVFIAVTGYGQPADLLNSEKAGFRHHLVKPIEPAELIALIGAL